VLISTSTREEKKAMAVYSQETPPDPIPEGSEEKSEPAGCKEPRHADDPRLARRRKGARLTLMQDTRLPLETVFFAKEALWTPAREVLVEKAAGTTRAEVEVRAAIFADGGSGSGWERRSARMTMKCPLPIVRPAPLGFAVLPPCARCSA